MSADQQPADVTTVRVELDLTATLEAMLEQQTRALAGMSLQQARLEHAEEVEELRTAFIGALQAGLPTLTDAIVQQMELAGWVKVAELDDDQLGRLGLARKYRASGRVLP